MRVELAELERDLRDVRFSVEHAGAHDRFAEELLAASDGDALNGVPVLIERPRARRC